MRKYNKYLLINNKYRFLFNKFIHCKIVSFSSFILYNDC